MLEELSDDTDLDWKRRRLIVGENGTNVYCVLKGLWLIGSVS